MIYMWLAMALMVAFSFAYLFSSVHKSVLNKSLVQTEDFIHQRQKEIVEEQENARISRHEAKMLLADLRSEESSTKHVWFWKPWRAERWLLLIMFVVVSLGSVSLYQHLGFAKDVTFAQQLANKTVTPKMTLEYLHYRSLRYGRAKDWYDEAQGLMAAAEYQKAQQAYQEVLKVLPKDSPDYSDVLVEYAQAIFYANGNRSSPRMLALVDKALAFNPRNATAQSLKGVAAFDNKDYLNAVLAWQMAARLNSNSTDNERQTLLAAIRTARQAGNINYQQVPPLITQRVSVKILWDKNQVHWQSGDVLLVYALAQGQPMPVAVRRVLPSALGQAITLTNLDSPMSKNGLEGLSKVDLVVKLSKVNAKDLTKGQVIGKKNAVTVNSGAIYTIKVTL